MLKKESASFESFRPSSEGTLGTGTRVGTTTNWQRTGLALPASGHLRARGATSGGYFNGSSGLIEQVAAFPPDATTLARW